MTINELIERLEECRDALGGDAEVRLMTQCNWPFENGIAGVTSRGEIRQEANPEDFDAQEDAEDVLYIVEGQQLGYGSKQSWDVCY